MTIIKRNGSEVPYDSNKIKIAIGKANKEGLEKDRLSDFEIDKIVTDITSECERETHSIGIEDIQDKVETKIMECGKFEIAKLYIRYRYLRNLKRNSNTLDDYMTALVDGNNEEVKQENSNKNTSVASVQRDYIAGEYSKDYSRRLLIPADIMKAHDDGLIHFHDLDYFITRIPNCSLINLEDMLQNGTVISGTRIDRPNSFSTACNIATQIIAQVASSQFGKIAA